MTQANATIIQEVSFWFAVGVQDHQELKAKGEPYSWRMGYTEARLDTTKHILKHALFTATRAERTNIGRVIRHELEMQRKRQSERRLQAAPSPTAA